MSYSPRTQPRTQAAKEIRDRINEGIEELHNTDPERERYVPEKDLSCWVTRDAILLWIEESDIESIEKAKFADDIIQYALKTFCILMELESEDFIKWFVVRYRSFGGPDTKLPWPNSAALASDLKHQDDSPKWSTLEFKRFYKKQWKYVVPKFYKGRDTIIPDNSKLPFFSNRSRGTDSGLSEVDFDGRYLLSHEEQPLFSAGRIKMMRKELCLEDNEKEKPFLQILHSWQMTRSPHIVDVYAYYIHNERGNILMPLLQGDVKGLLGEDEQCVYFESDDQYYAQMRNLAKAVGSLHSILTPQGFKITGIHHDLKPANILLHEGKFILADFGISTLLRPSAGEKQDSHGNLSWWSAPEEYADDPWSGKASPKSDMFHLGCIYMELLVHMRGKAQSVKAFRERRNPKKPHAAPFCEDRKLNPQVSLQLKEIREESGSDKRRQLADVIRDLLAHEPHDRPSAQDVVESLDRIIGEDVAESIVTNSSARSQTLDVTSPSSRLHSQDDQIGKEMASLTVSSAQRLDAGLPFGSPKGMTDKRLEKKLTVAEAISLLGERCKYETDVPSNPQARDLPSRCQGRIKYIWKHLYLREWASKSASDVLFLYSDSLNDEKVLLFIAKKVIRDAEVAQRFPKMVILRHFCTENKKNAEHSVLVMVKSLLRQLLSYRNKSESTDLPPRALARLSLESVLEIFGDLIKSLNKEMYVVCVIDGLYAYCNRSSGEIRKREAEKMLPHLTRLALTPRMTQCRFKLLLTASNKPLANRLSRDCGVLVRSIGHNISDQQGLSPRFFERNPLMWT